jgi:hypothetical protein
MSLIDKEPEEKDIEYYKTSGNIRYVTFIELDGKQHSFSYSLLPVFVFNPEGENDRNTLTIIFPSNTINLQGYQLEKLHEALESQTVKVIKSVEERHFQSSENKDPIVLHIEII